MLASKLVHSFSSHPAAFEFQASSPPHNITLNTTSKNTDQSFLIFRLVFVLLLMPLWLQSSSFHIPELHYLIPLPLYKVLMERLFQVQSA